MDVTGYLQSCGLEVEANSSDEINLECPSCGRQKLYVNAHTGAFKCQRCDINGGFQKLKQLITPPDPHREVYERFHELSIRNLLKNDTGALDYLFDRGFTEETIADERFGYADEVLYDRLLKEFDKETLIESRLWMYVEEKRYDFPYFSNHIIIPYMNYGQYVTFQGRAMFDTDTKYVFLPGHKPCLYHEEDLYKTGRVYLTEGAFKRARLKQEGVNAVAISGATQWKKFLPLLQQCEDLWIVLDSDAPDDKGKRPGQDAALEIAQSLDKCTLLTLPLAEDEDKIGVDDFIEEYGFDALENVKSVAFARGVESLPTSLSVLVHQWREKVDAKQERGYELGYPRFDEWLEGIHDGTLTFIAGAPHMMKTTLLEDMAVRSYRRNIELLLDYYSNDDALFTTFTRWIAKLAKLDPKDCRAPKVAFEDDDEAMEKFEAATRRLSKMEDRLRMLDRSYNISLESMKKSLLNWREDNPTAKRAIFIDGFGKTRTLKDADLGFNSIALDIYKSSLLKDIAQQAHIAILVTAEVPKLGGKRPHPWNLKGSGTLEYDADRILTCYQEAHVKGLERTNIKIEYEDGTVSPVLEVAVGKDKICGTPRKTNLFEFDKHEHTFREVKDEYEKLMRAVYESESKEWT